LRTAVPQHAVLPSAKIGVDVYSLRSQDWTPIQYLDYCAAQGAQLVHFSEIRFLGSLDTENLRQIRSRADDLGLDLEIGMRSICPTSSIFAAEEGTAEEQLGRTIDAARIVRSSIVRCFLGNSDDRRGEISLQTHILNTVAVLKNMRSRALDSGIRIAIENHSGDMQARELKGLVESAGPEFVGVCLDSGNPVWALEDPHLALETLAPHVLTSHIRDSRVWKTEDGAAAAWCRMGEGNIGIEAYLARYLEECPGRPVSLEIIVKGPRYFPYRDPDFWNAYRDTPPWEFARFLTLVERGTPPPASSPPSLDPDKLRAAEMDDFRESFRWTREFLAGSRTD